jgi:hypothetical protein
MKIITVDKRYKGYGHFKYYILLHHLKGPGFHELREWMWQTWGASKELEEWIYDNARMNSINIRTVYCQNEHWCWHNDNYERRLYIKNDEELMVFKLRWE